MILFKLKGIFTATTGREAMRLVGAASFDLIVLDVMLPDTGYGRLCVKSHE